MKSNLLALMALGALMAHSQAEVTPVLEYRLGEDDSPRVIGGPASNPSRGRTGGQNLSRSGAPKYAKGHTAIGSTHAIQLGNQPGVAPQFYSTEFDFEPTETGQWGFSCWVKFDALPDPDKSPEAVILHVGDINAGSILLQTFAKDGGIKFGTHAPGIAINVGNTEVQLGRWTHLAVVFDGGGRLFVDGVEDGSVGGGQNPPAGFTLGAARFTKGSFGSAATVTLDDVRLFEISPGAFAVGDLGIPPVTGPFVASTVGDPFGFVLEIADNGDSVLDPASLVLKLNGTTLAPTSVTKPGNTVIEYRRPVENPLPAGVYGIDLTYRDTAGTAYADARSFRVRSYTLVPLEFAVTGVDKGQRGFRIRPHQVVAEQPNSLAWTEEQLAGAHGPNLANLTGSVGGYFARDGVIDFKNELGRTGNFPGDAPFSEVGLPGPTLTTEDNAALEVLTYLEFPSTGFYTLGVNSDDGFRVSTGANAQDRLATVLGEVDGDRLAADSLFRIYIPQAGLYPFRLIWENGTEQASLEWFSVLSDGTSVLIGDTASTGALLAFRTGPSPAYVSAANPIPGEQAAPKNAAVTVTISDGDTTVSETSVRLGLNGPAGPPTRIAKTGGVTTATLEPSTPSVAGSTNTARLVYTDNLGRSFTNVWSYRVAEDTGAVALITPTGITQKAGNALDGFAVVNLINNSGFGTPPDAVTYATTTHNAAGNTWVTATSSNPNYFTAGNPEPRFDLSLGGVYELSHLVVWGYGGNNNEASDFTVEFSTDAGVTFSGSESVQTTTLLGGNAEALPFTTNHLANAIRVTMTNNGGGRGFSGAGSGDRAGLGEIKLLGRALSLITPTGITQKAGNALDGFAVVNLINNSGFGTTPDARTYATTPHNAAGNTWVTATASSPNYFSAGNPAPKFDLSLGGLFELSELVVWGYGGNNNEATDFTLEFSTDSGATISATESVQTPGLLGGNSAALVFTGKRTANLVRLTMTSNAGARGFTGAGTGDRVGLGEIKFLGIAASVEAGPALAASRTGDQLTLSWPVSAVGYQLESSDQLPGTTWLPVPGVADNRVTVTPSPGVRFYRLRKP